jgi:hypothetical protein
VLWTEGLKIRKYNPERVYSRQNSKGMTIDPQKKKGKDMSMEFAVSTFISQILTACLFFSLAGSSTLDVGSSIFILVLVVITFPSELV